MSGVLLSFSVFLFWLKERSKVLRKRSPFFFSSIASSQLFSSRIASLDAFFFASPCFAARGARLEDQVYVARRNVIKRNEFKKKEERTNLDTSTAEAAAAAVDDDLDDAALLEVDRGCARVTTLGRSAGLESALILSCSCGVVLSDDTVSYAERLRANERKGATPVFFFL